MILLLIAVMCLTFAGCFCSLSHSFKEDGMVAWKKHYKTIAIIFFVVFVISASLLCIGSFLTKDYTPTYEVTEYEITEYSEDELFVYDSLGRGTALICKCIDENNEEIELTIHLHNTKISLTDDTPKVIVEKPDNPWWYNAIAFDNIFECYQLYL